MAQTKMSLGEATTKVAKMSHETVKDLLRSNGVEIWLDESPILRRLLAEKIANGTICDPTDKSAVVVKR